MKARRIFSFCAQMITLFLFVYLLIFPQSATQPTRFALEFCGKTLIPSLFIYMVLSKMIVNTPIIHRLTSILGLESVALILGTLCGCPIGAKNAVLLYDNGQITKKHAEYLCSFSNNASISFVIGATEKTKITSMPYIALSCDEIALQSDISLLSLFLDLFSIYTFPQEYGADFEELRPLFNHKGRICVVVEPTDTNLPSNQVSYNLTIGNGEELFEPTIEPSSKATFILASRKPNKDEKIKKRSYCF